MKFVKNLTVQKILLEYMKLFQHKIRCYISEELQEPLQDFVKSHFPPHVRLIRTPHRFGLMMARIYGVNASSAMTYTFLDSHCECTDG